MTTKALEDQFFEMEKLSWDKVTCICRVLFAYSAFYDDSKKSVKYKSHIFYPAESVSAIKNCGYHLRFQGWTPPPHPF